MFWLAYLRGRTPWDTHVTPPELIRTIEGSDALPPGRCLDLGCGTGTNVIYLAQRGWDATGVDFVARAIRQARKNARATGVAAHFYLGDVTRTHTIEGLAGPFDMVLDIGCFHSLSPDGRVRYTKGMVDLLRPEATYMLYARGSQQGGGQPRGIGPSDVQAAFDPFFYLVRMELGEERGRPSAWYWFRLRASN